MESLTLSEPPGFTELSKAEQIRYLQLLWDRIAEQPGDIPVPESHLTIAHDRLEQYRRDPTKAHPARGIFDRLAKNPSE